MVVLGGGAVSYERGTPVGGGGKRQAPFHTNIGALAREPMWTGSLLLKPASPRTGRDCVKSHRSSYMGLYPQTPAGPGKKL